MFVAFVRVLYFYVYAIAVDTALLLSLSTSVHRSTVAAAWSGEAFQGVFFPRTCTTSPPATLMGWWWFDFGWLCFGLPVSRALVVVCRKIKFIALLYYFISELYKFVGLLSLSRFRSAFGQTSPSSSGSSPPSSPGQASKRLNSTDFGNGLIQLPVLWISRPPWLPNHFERQSCLCYSIWGNHYSRSSLRNIYKAQRYLIGSSRNINEHSMNASRVWSEQVTVLRSQNYW